MAIYRAESGRRVVLIAGAAAIAGLVLGLLIGRITAPGLGAQLDDVRAQAAPIASSLEVIRTEYPKLLAGGADPGGAEAAMARIETTYATVKPSLEAISPGGSAALGDAIAALRGAVNARVPETDVGSKLDDVQARLDAVLPG
jgi:hypothetical protein